MRAAWGYTAVLGLVAACGGKTSDESTSRFVGPPQSIGDVPTWSEPSDAGGATVPVPAPACDPLAPTPAPKPTFANILVTAQAEDGTVFVLDDGGPISVTSDAGAHQKRLFISSGSVLRPHAVYDESTYGDEQHYGIENDTALIVGATHTHAVVQGVDEKLVPIPASALGAFTLEADVVPRVRSITKNPDGTELVVVEPVVNGIVARTARVFFGPPIALKEGVFVAYTMSPIEEDHIVYTLDGVQKDAYLPLGPPNGDPATYLAGLTFVCK